MRGIGCAARCAAWCAGCNNVIIIYDYLPPSSVAYCITRLIGTTYKHRK